MKLKEFYKRVIEKGIKEDPRGKSEIRNLLRKKRKKYGSLRGVLRDNFDKENLAHPFADTRVLYGAPDTEIRTVMVGIDIAPAELLLADRLNQKGAGIDLVISHHPSGLALAGLPDVMNVHQNILESLGISQEVSKGLLTERISEVARRIHPGNLTRTVDVARLLDIPFMCAHTPADNQVVKYLQRLCDKKRPKRLSDILTILNGIPEYIDAVRQNQGPKLLIGDPKKEAGKIFVDMTGGTEGPKNVFSRLSQAGVGTIIAMHLSEEHYKSVKNEHINVIIAGHIASDSLGVNLLLDYATAGDDVRVIPCSGFVRVRR